MHQDLDVGDTERACRIRQAVLPVEIRSPSTEDAEAGGSPASCFSRVAPRGSRVLERLHVFILHEVDVVEVLRRDSDVA